MSNKVSLRKTIHCSLQLKISTVLSCISAVNKLLAPVAQTLDNAIHRINHYSADSVIDFRNTYRLDRDLSAG